MTIDPTGPRHHLGPVADDYFQPGPRPRTWMGSRVTWQHRTIENYGRCRDEGPD